MKRMKTLISAAVVLASSQLPAHADVVAPASRVDALAEVQSVERDGDAIRAVIRNDSDKRLDELTVLVEYNWLWKDEYNPGPDSPGWSEYVTLTDDIDAGASIPFEYAPRRPLPERNDGRFEPRLSVVAVTPYQ